MSIKIYRTHKAVPPHYICFLFVLFLSIPPTAIAVLVKCFVIRLFHSRLWNVVISVVTRKSEAKSSYVPLIVRVLYLTGTYWIARRSRTYAYETTIGSPSM